MIRKIMAPVAIIFLSTIAAAQEKATFGNTHQKILTGEEILQIVNDRIPTDSSYFGQFCSDLKKIGLTSPITGKPDTLQPSPIFIQQIEGCLKERMHYLTGPITQIPRPTGGTLDAYRAWPQLTPDEKTMMVRYLREFWIGPSVVSDPKAFDQRIVKIMDRQRSASSESYGHIRRVTSEIMKTREFLVY
ncbi:MAG: hypothetical protein JNL01_07845 [Bdellovibrionales bacterium]|nr:hypothetical protein [Bdellovibrionales bacterium]